MSKVEIYTKMSCPYCFRAKRLLDERGVKYAEYPVDMGGARKAEMIERAGGRTMVPQILIDGRHIGGCDDLFQLEMSGQLAALLAA